MPAPDELTLFAERLEKVSAPYMITGATAAILYGQRGYLDVLAKGERYRTAAGAAAPL